MIHYIAELIHNPIMNWLPNILEIENEMFISLGESQWIPLPFTVENLLNNPFESYLQIPSICVSYRIPNSTDINCSLKYKLNREAFDAVGVDLLLLKNVKNIWIEEW